MRTTNNRVRNDFTPIVGRIGEYAPLTDPESKPNHRPHNSDETRVTNPNSSTNGNAGQPAISLPVLGQKADGHDARPAIRRSKMGPRRAAVLILIHLAIAAHIIHWKIAGRTLSPVEPSEAMQTLNNGLVMRIDPNWFAVAPALIATKDQIDEMMELIERSLLDAMEMVGA